MPLRNGSMRRTRPSLITPTCGRPIDRRRGVSPRRPETFSDADPMPQIPIIMPQLGESIAEATVIRLLVKTGDAVDTDQDVIEVETNKATMNVTSPCPGRVEKLLVNLNESYPVGAVLGYLEASASDAARLGLDQPGPAEEQESETATAPDGQRGNGQTRPRV